MKSMYNKAIQMLNNAYFDDWTIAINLLSPDDKCFVNRVLSGKKPKKNTQYRVFKEGKKVNAKEMNSGIFYNHKEWRYIPILTHHVISKDGEVLRIQKVQNEKDQFFILKPKYTYKKHADQKQHRYVVIHGIKHRVALLVVYAWMEPGLRPTRVKYKDNNPMNCHYDNLIWTQPKERNIKQGAVVI